ncbi:acyclic terpene utilization AtuA family protein [Acidithrix ferrooxidans]|uniref:Exopolyphosphatase n=2 Tax=root TaxID=1 RepID=A0A0D8HED3_9ACTN|nr:acyclic terpene utilization AtuA family protein [Acidithrix ferrooxidans]KJF16320.1 hypothetical protein AXFE_28230 [Acidithrix ferrooxidans]
MKTKRAVRIANCSGFYGDRMQAALDMVEGGPIDFLTGDYLAELTMLILWKSRLKDPRAGYARTFLTQMEQVLGTCMDRGIKVVSNAGGLNPSGLANDIRQLAARLGLNPNVAYISGDDIAPEIPSLLEAGYDLENLDTKISLKNSNIQALTANAYLGGWGIVEALKNNADVVITGRVTDASLVVGPAAYWHGWERTDFNELAGAVVAGHIIECGPQATGGNYPFIAEITDRRYPGFPIAEVASDGTAVITKHPNTGGLVSVGTVTAQLLYEIAEPQYLNPDVIAHFDTIDLKEIGTNQVAVSGTKGSAPTQDLKVAINYLGGFRNTMTMVLTGLDIQDKAQWAQDELFGILGGKERFESVDIQLIRYDQMDAPSNELAIAHLRITIKDSDPGKVGRAFSGAIVELALGGYPGFHATSIPTSESAYGIYWPTLIPASLVSHEVVLSDGSRLPIPHTNQQDGTISHKAQKPTKSEPKISKVISSKTHSIPLGRLFGARSGDKGGNANVGLWARNDLAYEWLLENLGIDTFKDLLTEAKDLEVRRFELPNLRAINFVVVGLLGEGVASSSRLDPQAKGLGEYIRSRHLGIPEQLIPIEFIPK